MFQARRKGKYSVGLIVAAAIMCFESVSTFVFVDECPDSKSYWQIRSKHLKCDAYLGKLYHCIPTSDGILVELCMNPYALNTIGCPLLDRNQTSGKLFLYTTCNAALGLCPDGSAKRYFSNELFRYTACLHGQMTTTRSFRTSLVTEDIKQQDTTVGQLSLENKETTLPSTGRLPSTCKTDSRNHNLQSDNIVPSTTVRNWDFIEQESSLNHPKQVINDHSGNVIVLSSSGVTAGFISLTIVFVLTVVILVVFIRRKQRRLQDRMSYISAIAFSKTPGSLTHVYAEIGETEEPRNEPNRLSHASSVSYLEVVEAETTSDNEGYEIPCNQTPVT